MAAPADAFEGWFRLLETPGLGRGAARRLLRQCGSVEAVFDAPRARLAALLGDAPADALRQPPALVLERLDAARRWLDGGPRRHWVALGDPYYPPLLLHSPDPPLLLYLHGERDAPGRRGVAVVGSRHATAQGRDNARALAEGLSRRGLAVVSGLALGIDGAAHEGALAAQDGGGAPTVAVVGTGLDTVYPARHAALAERIAERGAVLSEFAPGMPPRPEHFPQRNRILAGLTLGTLVVEAALKSGSLITARLAADAGREVFAVPGSIHALQSRGCHDLLRQGATLVESVQDIVDELERPTARLGPALRPLGQEEVDRADGDGDASVDDGDAAADDAGAAGPTDDDLPAGVAPASRPLLRALGSDPVSLDDLQARTGWATQDLAATLLTLELDGHVARLPGGRYQRRHSA